MPLILPKLLDWVSGSTQFYAPIGCNVIYFILLETGPVLQKQPKSKMAVDLLHSSTSVI